MHALPLPRTSLKKIEFFMYFGDQSFVWCGIGEDIFPFSRQSFCLIWCVFCFTEASSFRRYHLFTVALSVCATGAILMNCSPVPMHWRLLSTFSLIRFSVVGFILRSLIHLDFSFVHGDRYGSIFILLPVDIQLSQFHLLKMNMVCTHLKGILAIKQRILSL